MRNQVSLVFDKETITIIKNDLLSLVITLISALIILKIVFFKEGLLVIIRLLVSFYWLYVLPGFSLLYYWREKFNFLERLTIGTALGFALIGIISYYIGLLGIHAKYHSIVLPTITLIAGVSILYFSSKKDINSD